MSELKPTLEDVLPGILRESRARVRTVLDGRIVKYDKAKQTADVEVTTWEIGGEKWQTIPDVKIAFPSSDRCRVVFGLGEGDEGLIVVHYLSPHEAWRKGEDSETHLDEYHGLSCEFWPRKVKDGAEWSDAPNPGEFVLGLSDGSLQIKFAGNKVTVLGEKVDLAGASDYVALAQKVDDNIATLKTAIGSGFTAVGVSTAANGPAGKTAFDSAAVTSSVAASDVKAS